MIKRVIQRLVLGVFIIFMVETATFFMMHLVPGGPFYSEKSLPENVRENLMVKFGLDQPLYVQYLRYLQASVNFDFGPSLKYRSRTVREVIFSSFKSSLWLGMMALLLSVIMGFPIGIFSAIRERGLSGKLADAVASFGISMPSFVVAVLFIYAFSYHLKILPPALWESPVHWILPVISLALPTSAVIGRLIKEGVVETAGLVFLQAVRARGVGKVRYLLHLIRPSLASFLGVFGPVIAMLITGSFVVEQIFSVPGLGRYFVLSVINRDYPLIMGITIFYCLLLVGANIFSDIIFFFIDPRSREQAV